MLTAYTNLSIFCISKRISYLKPMMICTTVDRENLSCFIGFAIYLGQNNVLICTQFQVTLISYLIFLHMFIPWQCWSIINDKMELSKPFIQLLIEFQFIFGNRIIIYFQWILWRKSKEIVFYLWSGNFLPNMIFFKSFITLLDYCNLLQLLLILVSY